MMHTGISHNTHLKNILSPYPSILCQTSQHLINRFPDTHTQHFCSMLQRIIRPHDHICTILRLRIHPALNCQSPPIRTIQQISRNSSRPNIKSRQTPPTSFLPHFQNPPSTVNHIPFVRIPAHPIQFTRQLQIHLHLPRLNLTICLRQRIQQPLPVRPHLPCFRLLQLNLSHPQSRFKHNLSVKSIRQNLLITSPVQCLHYTSLTFTNPHLTRLNNFTINLNQTLPTFPQTATRRIRLQSRSNLSFQYRCPNLHLYLNPFTHKLNPSHKKTSHISNPNTTTTNEQLRKIFYFMCICRGLRYS